MSKNLLFLSLAARLQLSYFTQNWQYTFTIHVPNLITAEFCHVTIHNICLNVHLKQCAHKTHIILDCHTLSKILWPLQMVRQASDMHSIWSLHLCNAFLLCCK
jgi:hypothetical protein